MKATAEQIPTRADSGDGQLGRVEDDARQADDGKGTTYGQQGVRGGAPAGQDSDDEGRRQLGSVEGGQARRHQVGMAGRVQKSRQEGVSPEVEHRAARLE